MRLIVITLLSLSLLAPARAAIPGAEELADVILELDTSGDGVLDSSEYREGTADGFSDIDRDRDGRITTGEIDALGGLIGEEQGSVAGSVVPPLIKLMLGTMDANGDKVLSREEYTRGAQSLFTLLDVDKDGTLTRAELVNLPARLVKSAVQ
jgi:Ca2+-binding EF-hand superfamily protein